MELIRCILHIMDTGQNMLALSDQPIEKLNEDIEPILISKLNRIFRSQNKRQAVFQNSEIEKMIFDYKMTKSTFVETSKQIAQRIFEEKRKYNVFHTSDFVFCEVKVNDIRYLVGIDNANTKKLTHTIHSLQDQITNEFLLHRSLFSENIIKEDRIFIVEYATSALQLIENPFHEIYVYEILQCKANKSYKETVQCIHMSAENITEKYNLNALEIMPALKSKLVECTNEEETIQPEELAQHVFYEQPVAQRDFVDEIKSQGIVSIQTENFRLAKNEKTEKIKTDSGIEITIPIDLLTNKENIEFISEEDGKLSIRLRNIQSITRK